MTDEEIVEELLKLDLFPEDVTDPRLFIEKLIAAETFEECEEVRAMIIKK